MLEVGTSSACCRSHGITGRSPHVRSRGGQPACICQGDLPGGEQEKISSIHPWHGSVGLDGNLNTELQFSPSGTRLKLVRFA
jgi:hypothetical protein